ncbi:hypothetical protein G6F57_019568 [Rhizopus arrhizus]|nr:hypothetical protein G6F57_019568 [Rhizopus arrhizus]
MLFGQFARPAHHAAAAFGGRGQDHLGAIGAHQLAAFHREGLDHGGHELVAARGGDHRQRHAGIAGGRFDDRVAGLEQATCFGIEDDRQRQAVLHRAARVERLDLGVDADLRWRQALQLDDGGVADGIEDGVVQGHGSAPETGPRRASAGEGGGLAVQASGCRLTVAPAYDARK